MQKNQDTDIVLSEYEKKIFDLNQLLEISSSLNSTMDFNLLIDSILYICMGQMRTIKAGIFVRKSLDCEDLIFNRNCKGFELRHDLEYSIPEDNPFIEFIANNFHSMTLDEIGKNCGRDDLETLFELNPALIVPMRSKNRINGILVLGEKIVEEPYSEDEKAYLLQIANFASIAIHNSILFEMTTTDMMTKLKMKHFFMTTLADKQELNKDIDGTLALIMMDIDHFKNLNDTYGHTCGDLVLVNVAKKIIESVRQVDTAARYGGEEFVVLLPESDINIARSVAERIRSEIETMEIIYDNQTIKTTISIGIAIYDSVKDTTTRTFINRADKALYYSKHHGRNTISEAE